MAYGNFRSSMSRCGICNCHYDRAANESDQPVFCGSASGDRWNISAVYGGQYCGVKAVAENPWVLLPKKAFYRCIDDDVPDEAECGGAGKHLYFIDDGDGHGVYHGLYVCAGFDDEINMLYPYEINVQTGYSEVKENVSEQSSDIIQFIEDTGTNVTDSESYSYLNFAMTLEKDSLTIGQKPTNASLYFLTRDNFLRMDHTLTEADVPKVEAGKILIYREKRFQSTKTLRGDQIQILGETFTVQQNGYCKNRCNGGAISFMDGVYYIVVDHMQTLQKLQKLAIAEANTENVSAYAYENVLGINITGTETEKIACSGNVENYSSGEKYGVVWRRVRGRAVNRKELLALYGGFFFLGIFLGIVFLAVTVMIIFYKQVSEGYEDKERYRIMEQVGMSNVEVKSAIETQIRMVFFLPIVVAALHAVAAFPLIRRVLSLLIMDSGQLFVWCLVTTVLAFAVIYYVVFRITSKIYYRIVGNQVR